MRTLMISTLLLACGGSAKPAAESPPPATSSLLDCTKVADHVASAVAAQEPRTGVTPGAVEEMIQTRCQTDAWTHETRQCFHAMKTVTDGRACATGMTDVQRDAIKAHARQLRASASGPSTDTDDSADWIKHVAE